MCIIHLTITFEFVKSFSAFHESAQACFHFIPTFEESPCISLLLRLVPNAGVGSLQAELRFPLKLMNSFSLYILYS
jgi:hypothetical protein